MRTYVFVFARRFRGKVAHGLVCLLGRHPLGLVRLFLFSTAAVKPPRCWLLVVVPSSSCWSKQSFCSASFHCLPLKESKTPSLLYCYCSKRAEEARRGEDGFFVINKTKQNKYFRGIPPDCGSCRMVLVCTKSIARYLVPGIIFFLF